MAQPLPAVRVLLVDDDRQEFVLLEGLFAIISQSRFTLEWVEDYASGLAKLRAGGFDVCLIDYRLLGEKTGLDLLKRAKAENVRVPMILLTGLWDTAVDLAAMKAGAADYLVKGQFGPEMLERSLRYAVERGRATAALEESEALYRALVEGTGAAVCLADEKGAVERVNELWRAAFGERLPADPAAAEALAAAAEARAPRQLEFRDRREGAERWYFGVAAPVAAGERRRLALIVRDVTERRELEAKYLQSEKMSAMGFLAAGIAHELNTPLGVILGNVAALDDLRKTPAARKRLDVIERAVQRCRALVDGLLAFARKEDEAPREFALEEAVSGALSLVAPEARVRIVDVRHEFRDPPLLVRGHRNRIEQVLINLGNNALDALAEGGRLVFRTSLERRDGRAWARVQVIDNGRGIPKAILPKVTEPFFTTKKEGRGTGLGLSLASEIVAKHGGTLSIESAVGKGTTVTVLLPRSS